jgi:hypothetical protein
MSNVISSLLVGIGIDFDKKSAKQTESGIDGIKSKALQLGAVVAGAYGVKKLATDFADSADMLGKFSQTYSLAAEDVQALGSALGESGGGLSDAMSQLESLEKFRAGLLKGDASFIASFGISSGDANDIIDAKDAVSAYVLLADQFEKATPKQRLNMADALGFNQSGLLLMSKGSEEVENLLTKYRQIRPLTEKMTDSAAKFNAQWVEVKANLSGITDAIGQELLPVINDVTESINNWFSSDRLKDLKAISELTKATFGQGDAEETAKATGLPKWLFTSDISDTVDAVMGPSNEKRPTNNVNGGSLYNKSEMMNDLSTRPMLLNSQRDNMSNTLTESGRGSQQQQRNQSTINVNASFTLDGKIIDNKIINVVDRMTETAIDEIKSSTGG